MNVQNQMFFYAHLLERGIGVAVNINEAIKYYQMSYENGVKAAQYCLERLNFSYSFAL